jgi:hypothetical protein
MGTYRTDAQVIPDEAVEVALNRAADLLESQPPKTHAQYVSTLRLYAAEPWRLNEKESA